MIPKPVVQGSDYDFSRWPQKMLSWLEMNPDVMWEVQAVHPFHQLRPRKLKFYHLTQTQVIRFRDGILWEVGIETWTDNVTGARDRYIITAELE
jgi:hypothetical protein